jgi:hypothetical protein
MLAITKEILESALSSDKALTAEYRVAIAYDESMGLNSTDSLSAMVLEELHHLGFLLNHKI